MPRKNSRRKRSGRSRRGGDIGQTVSGWWSSLTGNRNNNQYDSGYGSGSGSGYGSGSGSGSGYDTGMGTGMGSNMGSGYDSGSNMVSVNSYGGRKPRRTMKRGGMPVPYSPSVWGNQSPFPKAVGGKRRKTRRMRKTRK